MPEEVIISVVIPVYNGAKYIARLLESFRKQHFVNFEVLMVDDESTDDSLKILEHYAACDARFRIINKKNDGAGCAVKGMAYALPFVRGEYFFYSSQDDVVSEELLKNLYERAVEAQADAVVPDMVFLYNGDVKGKCVGPPSGDYSAVLSGKEAFVQSLSWKVHGFALRKTALVRRIGFDTSVTNGDELAIRKYYLNSNKVAFSHGLFFYFMGNADAITKKVSWQMFDWLLTEIKLMGIIRENGLGTELEKKFSESLSVCFNRLSRLYLNNLELLRGHDTSIRMLLADSARPVLIDCLKCKRFLPFAKSMYWYVAMKLRLNWF